jgi:hypothetical protein
MDTKNHESRRRNNTRPSRRQKAWFGDRYECFVRARFSFVAIHMNSWFNRIDSAKQNPIS